MADYGLNGPCIDHLCVLGWLPGAIDSSEDLAKDVLFASGDILEYDAREPREFCWSCAFSATRICC